MSCVAKNKNTVAEWLLTDCLLTVGVMATMGAAYAYGLANPPVLTKTKLAKATTSTVLAMDVASSAFYEIIMKVLPLAMFVAAFTLLYQLKSRISEQRKYRTLLQRTGAFTSRGKTYYREGIGAPLYEKVLVRSTEEAGGGIATYHYEYALVSSLAAPDSMKLESSLPGSVITRTKKLPKGIVIIGFLDDVEEQFVPLGVGFRLEEHLISARHVFSGRDAVHLYNDGIIEEVSLADLKQSPCGEYAGTYLDVAALKLPLNTWSRIGISKLALKNITSQNANRVQVFGADMEGLLTSHGALQKNFAAGKILGMTEHLASTYPGFSGSPLIARDTNGNQVIVGLHTAGTLYSKDKNLAIGGEALKFMCRRLLGIEDVVPNITISDFLETYDRSERQVSFEEPDFNPDVDYVRQARDQVLTGVLHDSVSALVIGGGDTGDAEADAGRALGKLSSKFSRTRWADMSDDAWLLESRKATIAQLQQGSYAAVKGKRFWARYNGEQIPDPLQTDAPLTPTAADVLNLFERAIAGDYSAFADAGKYDRQGMLDAFKDSPADPFAHFRMYLDQTHQFDMNKGRTLTDANGSPFFVSGGRTHAKFNKKPKPIRRLTPDQVELFNKLGLDPEWVMPPNAEKDIVDSLASQASRQKPGALEMTEEDFYKELEQAFPDATSCVKPLAGVKGLHAVFETFEEKSSGWSSKFYNKTKKAFVEHHGKELVAICIARLLLRAASWREIASMTPEAMLRAGLVDPKELFVKTEPHGADKTSNLRWRLIWNCSLVDTTCQALVSLKLNKLEIERYQTGLCHHVAAGLGHHDEGIARLGAAVEEMCSSGWVHSADASGWDLSVSRDHLIWDATARIFGAALDTEQERVGYAALTMCDAFCNSAHVLCSGKELWFSERYGQTASGVPNTTSQNNRARGMGIRVAGVSNRITAGDDLLTDCPPDEAVLATQGTITKAGSTSVSPVTGPWDFTSHRFTKVNGKWHAEFLNLGKSLAKLTFAGKIPSKEQLGGLYYAVRHDSAKVKTLDSFCEASGWTPVPPAEWQPPDEWNDLM